MSANDQIFCSCLNGTLEVLVDEVWELAFLNSGKSPISNVNYLKEVSLYIATAKTSNWYSTTGMDWDEMSMPHSDIFVNYFTETLYINGTYLGFNDQFTDIWISRYL